MFPCFSVTQSDTRTSAGPLSPRCEPVRVRELMGRTRSWATGGATPPTSLGLILLWRWECEGQVTQHPSTDRGSLEPSPSSRSEVSDSNPPAGALLQHLHTPHWDANRFCCDFWQKLSKVWTRRATDDHQQQSYQQSKQPTACFSSEDLNWGSALGFCSEVLNWVFTPCCLTNWSIILISPNINEYFTFSWW